PYEMLESVSALLETGLRGVADAHGVPLTVNRVGSMIGFHLTAAPGTPVEDFAAVTATDARRFARFFHGMLSRGVMIPPSRFEAWFVSLAHTPDDVQLTIDAADGAFAALAAG